LESIEEKFFMIYKKHFKKEIIVERTTTGFIKT